MLDDYRVPLMVLYFLLFSISHVLLLIICASGVTIVSVNFFEFDFIREGFFPESISMMWMG